MARSPGTIGGGCVEAEVWAAAKEVMQKEAPRKMVFNLNNEASLRQWLICGGTLEVFVEPILPQPMLYLFAAGMSPWPWQGRVRGGIRIGVVDDRETFANQNGFRWPRNYHQLRGSFQKIHPNVASYLVIVTRGHKEDMRVLAWAVRTEARYIGMIGSKRKVLSVVQSPGGRWLQAGRVRARVCADGAGDGALSPEEIAVSIVAEWWRCAGMREFAAHKKLKYEAHASPILRSGGR